MTSPPAAAGQYRTWVFRHQHTAAAAAAAAGQYRTWVFRHQHTAAAAAAGQYRTWGFRHQHTNCLGQLDSFFTWQRHLQEQRSGLMRELLNVSCRFRDPPEGNSHFHTQRVTRRGNFQTVN